MTEEILKKALRVIVKDDLHCLVNTFYDNMENVLGADDILDRLDVMTDGEKLDWVVSKLYSDELLAAVEGKMTMVPVCNMSVSGYDTGDLAVEYEINIGHIFAIPKVWPKRMALVGACSCTSVYGVVDFFEYNDGAECYIDEDGSMVRVVFHENRLLFESMERGDCPNVKVRRLAHDNDDKCFGLGELLDLLPKEFVDPDDL